jgi:hypothetical protein
MMPSVFDKDSVVIVNGQRAELPPSSSSYRASVTDPVTGAEGYVAIAVDPETGALTDGVLSTSSTRLSLHSAARLNKFGELSDAETAAFEAQGGIVASESASSPLNSLFSTASASELESVSAPGARQLLLKRWTNCLPNDSAYRLRLLAGVAHGVTTKFGGVAGAVRYVANTFAFANAVFLPQVGVMFSVSRLLVCTDDTCVDDGAAIEWNMAYDSKATTDVNFCSKSDSNPYVLSQGVRKWRDETTAANKLNAAATVFSDCFRDREADYRGAASATGAAGALLAAYTWQRGYSAAWLTFAHNMGRLMGATPVQNPDKVGGIMDNGILVGGILKDTDADNPGEIGFITANDRTSICSYLTTAITSNSDQLYVTPRSHAFVELAGPGIVCGNGIVEPGEECDAGNSGNACCTTQCKYTAGSRCGDTDTPCCKNCQPEPAATACTPMWGSAGFCGAEGRCTAVSQCNAQSNNNNHCGFVASNPCVEMCQSSGGSFYPCSSDWPFTRHVPVGTYCTVPGTTNVGRCHKANPSVVGPTTCQTLAYVASDLGTFGECVCDQSSTQGIRTRPLTCREQGVTLVAQSLCAESREVCSCSATESYTWSHDSWGPCTAKSCDADAGTHTREVVCRNNAGTIVDASNCVGAGNKPDATGSCTAACDYSYKCKATGASAAAAPEACDDVKHWSATCSSSCGTGTQTRDVACYDSFGKAAAVGRCTGTAPTDSRTCTGTSTCRWICRASAQGSGAYDVCTAENTWGVCSATICGSGTQTRSVVCANATGTPMSAETFCTASGAAAGTRPADSRTCSATEPCTSQWRCKPSAEGPGVGEDCASASSWTTCSTTCGTGTRSRSVSCISSAGATSELCSGEKPPSTGACTVTSGCTAQPQWVCGDNPATRLPCNEDDEWSTCSGSCAPNAGVQKRTVTCVGASNAELDASVCAAAGLTKPSTVRAGCQVPEASCTFAWRCYAPGSSTLRECSDAASAGSDWSACSSSCAGTRTRGVGCFDVSMSTDASAAPVAVPVARCTGTAPARTTACASTGCTWLATAWTGCPSCINEGAAVPFMSRTTQCVDATGTATVPVAAASCSAASEPEKTASCTGIPSCASAPLYKWLATGGNSCTGICGTGSRSIEVSCCRYAAATPEACTTVSDAFCPAASRPSSTPECTITGTQCSGRGVCVSQQVGFPARAQGVCQCFPGSTGEQCATVATLTGVAFTSSGASASQLKRGDVLTVTWSYSAAAWAGAANKHVLVTLMGANGFALPLGAVPSSVQTFSWTVPASQVAFSGAQVVVTASASLAATSTASFAVASVCVDTPAICGAHGTCLDTFSPAAPCACSDSYSGVFCSVSPCEAARCSERGTDTCTAVTGCSCKAAFSGPRCLSPATCPQVAREMCKNGGARIATLDGSCGSCACEGSWAGATCETCARKCAGLAVSGAAGSPTSDCAACKCNDGFIGDNCQCRGVSLRLSFKRNQAGAANFATAATRSAYFDRVALELSLLAQVDLTASTSAGKISFVRYEDFTGSDGVAYVLAWYHLNGFCAEPTEDGRFVVTADTGAANSLYMASAHAATQRLLTAFENPTQLAGMAGTLAASGATDSGIGATDAGCEDGEGCPAAAAGTPPGYGESEDTDSSDSFPDWAIGIIVAGSVVIIVIIAVLIKYCCCNGGSSGSGASQSSPAPKAVELQNNYSAGSTNQML